MDSGLLKNQWQSSILAHAGLRPCWYDARGLVAKPTKNKHWTYFITIVSFYNYVVGEAVHKAETQHQ
jgi:uncharacterized protein YcfL